MGDSSPLGHLPCRRYASNLQFVEHARIDGSWIERDRKARGAPSLGLPFKTEIKQLGPKWEFDSLMQQWVTVAVTLGMGIQLEPVEYIFHFLAVLHFWSFPPVGRVVLRSVNVLHIQNVCTIPNSWSTDGVIQHHLSVQSKSILGCLSLHNCK